MSIENLKKMKTSGFSLVELMVVVAIIGILSAVAIPNFRSYQAKAKTSEAKLALSAVYTAEIGMQTDYDTFVTCLTAAGYSHSTNTYYAIGFTQDSNAQNTVAYNNGAGSCYPNQFVFPASRQIGTASVDSSTFKGQTSGGVFQVTDAVSFRAGAVGYIQNGMTTEPQSSVLSIDQDKKITQHRNGYN